MTTPVHFRYDGHAEERGAVTIIGAMMTHAIGRWHLGLEAVVPICEDSGRGIVSPLGRSLLNT
jgi:hypothetical protein